MHNKMVANKTVISGGLESPQHVPQIVVQERERESLD